MLPAGFRPWLAVVVLAAPPGFVRADDPKPTRSEKELLEAAQALNAVDSKQDQEKKLRELLAKKERPNTKAMVTAAAKEQEAAEKGKSPYKFPAAILLANAALATKEYSAADVFYKYSAEQGEKAQSVSKLVQAYTGLIDLTWAQKKYDECAQLCGRFIQTLGGAGDEADQVLDAVFERRMFSLVKQGESDKALEEVQNVLHGYPGLELKARIQRELGKYKEAVETQTEVIERIKDEDKLSKKDREIELRRVTYLLSGYYLDADQVDKATDVLEKLVKENPENSTFKNDLGFLWCDHDKKLDESEKLIKEALDIDKKLREKLLKEGKITKEEADEPNASYTDSLGWVFFKKKNYAEAKKYLLIATKDEDEGNNMEIWDHLADCHMAMGEVKEAVDVWTKSLKMDDVTKKDEERRKKVTAKLTAAKAQLKK